ncbi:hypothetical protein EMIT013CA1_10159 [Bacillus sp. IT-13CA1]
MNGAFRKKRHNIGNERDERSPIYKVFYDFISFPKQSRSFFVQKVLSFSSKKYSVF